MRQLLQRLELAAFLLLVATASGAPRVAVLDAGVHASVQGLAEMVTLELEHGGLVQLVERQELRRILEERAWSAAGAVHRSQAVELGGLLHAQGLLTLEPAATNGAIRCRLIETSAGLRLADFDAIRGVDLASQAKAIVAKLTPRLGALRGTPDGLIVIGAISFFNEEVSDRTLDPLARSLGNALARKLGGEEDVLVVERQRLGLAADEHFFATRMPRKLLPAALMVYGTFHRRNDLPAGSIAVKFRCAHMGTVLVEQEFVTSTGNETDVATRMAEALLKAVRGKEVPAISAAQEAKLLAEESVHNSAFGAHELAMEQADAALALEPGRCDREQRLLEAMSGFLFSELAPEAGRNMGEAMQQALPLWHRAFDLSEGLLRASCAIEAGNLLGPLPSIRDEAIRSHAAVYHEVQTRQRALAAKLLAAKEKSAPREAVRLLCHIINYAKFMYPDLRSTLAGQDELLRAQRAKTNALSDTVWRGFFTNEGEYNEAYRQPGWFDEVEMQSAILDYFHRSQRDPDPMFRMRGVFQLLHHEVRHGMPAQDYIDAARTGDALLNGDFAARYPEYVGEANGNLHTCMRQKASRWHGGPAGDPLKTAVEAVRLSCEQRAATAAATIPKPKTYTPAGFRTNLLHWEKLCQFPPDVHTRRIVSDSNFVGVLYADDRMFAGLSIDRRVLKIGMAWMDRKDWSIQERQMSPEPVQNYDDYPTIYNYRFFNLAFDGPNIWVATPTQGLLRFARGQKPTSVRSANGLASDYIVEPFIVGRTLYAISDEGRGLISYDLETGKSRMAYSTRQAGAPPNGCSYAHATPLPDGHHVLLQYEKQGVAKLGLNRTLSQFNQALGKLDLATGILEPVTPIAPSSDRQQRQEDRFTVGIHASGQRAGNVIAWSGLLYDVATGRALGFRDNVALLRPELPVERNRMAPAMIMGQFFVPAGKGIVGWKSTHSFFHWNLEENTLVEISQVSSPPRDLPIVDVFPDAEGLLVLTDQALYRIPEIRGIPSL